MHEMRRIGKWAGYGGVAALGWLLALASPESIGQTKKTASASPAAPLSPSVPDYDKNIVAYVNGQPVTRLELAEDLITRKGKAHLELLINRRIIEQECAKAGVTVSDEEIDAEVRGEMSARNLVDPRNFETLLKQQGFTLYEYKEDVVRRTIQMRKLARSRVQVTEEEIQKSFQVNFGERVLCRVILVLDELGKKNRKEAEDLYFKVKDEDDAFITAAKQQQIPHLASNAGETVVGHYNTQEHVAKEAFRLKDGEVSHILQVPEGWLILKRLKLIPADQTRKLEDVRAELEKMLFNKKMEAEVRTLFLTLKKQAVVRDYLNNEFGINDVMTESYKESERRLQSGAVKPAPRGPATAGGKN